MFEQFRILRAAARLGEFTIADLAAASGVSEGTVQKTLRRRGDLFEKSAASKPGPNRRPLRIYRFLTEAAGPALQAAADAPPRIPAHSEGPPVALAVAEDTLIATFPKAHSSERRALLTAAADELSLVPTEWAAQSHSLVAIYARLMVLVEVQEWLLRLTPRDWPGIITDLETPKAAIDGLHGAIDQVLSAESRAERERDSTAAERAALRLLRLSERAARLAAGLQLEAPPPPSPGWTAEVIAAAWGMIADPLWSAVAGDLADPRQLAEASRPRPPARAKIVERDEVVGRLFPETSDTLFSRPWEHLEWEPNANLGRQTSVAHWPTRLGYEPYAHKTDELVALSRGPLHVTWRIRLDEPRLPFGSIIGSEGYLAAIDLDLPNRRVVGVSVYPAVIGAPSRWLPYREVLAVHRTLEQRLKFGTSDDLTAEPKVRRDAEKVGACLWTDDQTIEVRMAEPVALVGLHAESMDFSMRAEMERKLADVWALEFQGLTGRLVTAHARQVDSNAPVTMPLTDMEYDPNRGCFVHHGLPGGRAASRKSTGFTLFARVEEDFIPPPRREDEGWRPPRRNSPLN